MMIKIATYVEKLLQMLAWHFIWAPCPIHVYGFIVHARVMICGFIAHAHIIMTYCVTIDIIIMYL